jgi:hypothetical protein
MCNIFMWALKYHGSDNEGPQDVTSCSLVNKYPNILEKHAALIPGVDMQTIGSSDTSVFTGYTASHTGRQSLY